jgi:stalled ribosome rescue protein Dom34
MALKHPLVESVIEEQMFNLRISPDDDLAKYGLMKIATYAAQVARAQALGFDPDLLRLTDEEATEAQLRLLKAFEQAGKPVTVVVSGDSEGGA